MKVFLIILYILSSCKKDPVTIQTFNRINTECKHIFIVYRYSRVLISDFGIICDTTEINRWANYPKYSPIIPGCDTTQQEVVIKKV